jgi:hypothetical protein
MAVPASARDYVAENTLKVFDKKSLISFGSVKVN